MGSSIFFDRKFFLFVISVITLTIVCHEGVSVMVSWWKRDEYSHGYLIPLVAIYLAFQKRAALEAAAKPSPLLGGVVLFGAIFIWILGEVSSIYTVIQYGFWVGIWALALCWVGINGVKVIWASLFYLVFMIPLPNFLFFSLSQELQLISSSIGVAVIRFFDISVFLEGNVIDLGVYKLQVVEACNGLRYLFPLMSFGFLIAYIYKGPFWQRLIIFLSTIPITVLMNSFRIGLIGVTVEHFGIAAAEGVLHDFEGFVIFLSCIGVLLFEIWLFYIFSKREKSFGAMFDLDFGANDKVVEGSAASDASRNVGQIVALVTLLLMLPVVQLIQEREDVIPDRVGFGEFPLRISDWRGTESALEADVLSTLKPSDYFIARYSRPSDTYPVDFYTPWYAEQRKGASIHSPKTCLPGGGWVILSHTVEKVDQVDAYGSALNINRVLMQMGEHKQLVYYWFQGRGRNITNEYLAKWFIFWDSLTRRRTDGALVRLVTYVPQGEEAAAEQRMTDFLETVYPKFSDYIPD